MISARQIIISVLCLMGSKATATVPDGIWTMPEPTGLEYTNFTTDGERYILYNPDTKLFFASGNGWNVMASLRTFGMEIWVQESAEEDAPEGSYELWDNNVNNPARSTGELNMFTDDGNFTWVDNYTQGNYSWGVEIKDGLVRFQNVALIADKPEFEGMYLGFDGTFVVADNSAGDANHRDAYTAILRHVNPSTAGASVDFKAVTIDSYEAFVASDEYEAYQSGVKTYLASIGLKEAIENAEAMSIDVTDALAVYSDKSSNEEDMANAAATLNEIAEAKAKLKAAIEEYEGKGFTGTADAKAVLNNTKATKTEIEKAHSDLDAAAIEWGKNNASVENPADMTSKIVNPHFDNGDATTGWSGDSFGRGGTVSDGAEHYSKNYDTYQTITGLAPGVYAVGVSAFYRAGNYGGDAENHWVANDDASKYAKLYGKVGDNYYETPIANVMSGAQAEAPDQGEIEATYQDGDGNEVTVFVPNSMKTGEYFMHTLKQYTNKLLVAVDEAGELTIGVKKTTQISGDWSYFDDFSLNFYGTGSDAAKLYLDETLKNYSDYTPEEDVIYTKSYLDAYKAAYSGEKTAANLSEATTIINGISDAYNDLQKNMELWKDLRTAVEKGQKMSIDPKYDGLLTVGALADYCNDDYEPIETAAKLTNEQLEAEIEKVNKMIEDVINESKADVHDGKDMTDYIVNPGFDEDKDIYSGKAEGWTIDRIDGGNVVRGPLGKTNQDLIVASLGEQNFCFESWHCHKWDVWQEVKNLPVGMYELQVQGFVRCEVGGYNRGEDIDPDYPSPVYLYMNNAMSQFPSVYSETRPINPNTGEEYEYTTIESWTTEDVDGYLYPNSMGGAAQCFDWGMYKTKVYGLITKQGDKLRIGVKMNENQDWLCDFDNFKLTYRTPSIELVQPILEEALNTIDLTQAMGKEEFEKAIVIKADAEAALNESDATAQFTVLEKVYNVKAEINASVAKFKELIAAHEELANAVKRSQASDVTKTEANNLIYQITSGVDNHAISTEDIDDIIVNVEYLLVRLSLPAVIANASDENPVECTGVIKSPSFETADMESTSEGWTNPGNLGNDAEQQSALAMEFWQTSFDMYQTIKGLPAGTYKLTVDAWVHLGGNDETYKAWNEDPNATMAYAYAVDGNNTAYSAPVANLMKAGDNLSGSTEFVVNEEEGIIYYMPNTLVEGRDVIEQNEGLFTTEVICKVLEDGVLTIGIKKAETVTNSWVVLDNFRLFYMGTNSAHQTPAVVDVTDISAINNVIYIEPMEARTGTQATISLKMKNTAEIRAFQFDLYLPEGVTAVKSAKGRIQGFLSAGRLPEEDEHTLSFSEQPDGAIRFLCGSEYDETFTGNNGEIATLLVNIADNIADGDYPIQLKGMKLTETDISKYYETALVQSKLTISTYVIGDINGDGVVDVSDYTGVANHIHNNTPAGFNAKAADVDESGGIDVSDYTGIANIIHTGSIYGNNSNARMMVRGPRKVNTDLSGTDNVLYIEPLETTSDTQLQLSLKMKNTAAIRGFQVDVHLPDGVKAVKNNNGRIKAGLNAGRLPEGSAHTLTVSEQPDGAIRLLCGSQYDETFKGTDGEVATLTINVAGDVKAGNYPLTMSYVKLTETDIKQSYLTGEVASSITVLGGTNGITSARRTNETDNYYDLQGRRVTPMKKGIYIQNGQKVIVK